MEFQKTNKVKGSIRKVEAKKTMYIAFIFALFSTLSLSAQTTPEPPQTPNPPQTSSSETRSVATSKNMEGNSSSSISVATTNESYKFRARYNKSKTEGVKTMLLENLGKDNLKVTGSTFTWTVKSTGGEVFKCRLSKGQLRIFVDKLEASEDFVNKISELGNDIKHYVSGTSALEESKKAKAKAERELERAERELARAKREVERAGNN
ncbi:MAG: hypothetical protein Wins2KO_05200 [Winogradskyella sp.]